MVSRDLEQPFHNPVHLEHRTTAVAPGCRGPHRNNSPSFSMQGGPTSPADTYPSGALGEKLTRNPVTQLFSSY